MKDNLVSIIIPARTEKYLNRTIRDILDKATGPIEIFPVLDGYPDTYSYEKIKDSRVHYITFPVPHENERHKRQAVNAGVSISRGKYVCWIDAHCVVALGFDEVLKRDCEENMVIVPKKYKMNRKKWDREKSDVGNYRYWMWRYLRRNTFEPYNWTRRAKERENIMIDDIFVTQGSFFFMHRKWFEKMKFMQVEGYMGWGQESEEICLTTILNGGRVVIDKNTWYSHLTKKQMPKRMYKVVSSKPSYVYSFNYWVHEQREFFKTIIEKFGPIPNWPENWEEIIYEKK